LLPQDLHALKLGEVDKSHDEITSLATSLLEKWARGLYGHQTVSPGNLSKDGGIYSPGDKAYPFEID